MSLAPFATHAAKSKGRFIAEPISPTRGPYQRDRDRVIHSSAFRRLRNKTQVFIESEGDYFRTRLTHSLEVAQIARAITRNLKIDEDLAEALALAHDLGHTCFGHAGEVALNEMMEPYGGFDHNDQTFRILTLLEKKYAAFDGLNLTWEMLEGIAKHNGPLLPLKEGKAPPVTIMEFQKKWDLQLEQHAGIEAQIAAFSDDIAYNTHDFDDGYNAGLFEMDELANLPIFRDIVRTAKSKYSGDLEKRRLIHEIVREAIGILVQDLLAETQRRLKRVKPRSAEEVRAAGAPLAGFSPQTLESLDVLRVFLHEHMYRHARVKAMTERAALLVKKLFWALMDKAERLPEPWYRDLIKKGGDKDETARARMIADYIAGMTDRFAEQEYKRLFPSDNLEY
jgi:dGTPase